jgi:hypothetical protein
MSNPKKQPTSSRPLLLQGLGVMVAAALGVLLALLVSGSSRTTGPKLASTSAPSGAYRPSLRAAWTQARSSEPSPSPASQAGDAAATSDAAAEDDDDALPPELQARLRAAAHVATVPAQAGAPLPPSADSLPPEAQIARHQAMIGWQTQVQQLLDRCVARPQDLRQPAEIQIVLAPPLTDAGLAPQQLAPVAVSLPAAELRRLWQDTDPDALQGCLDQVRTLAIAVPPPPNSFARVMPGSFESLRVQL